MNDNKENSQLLPFHKSNDRVDDRQTIEDRDELGQLLHKVQFPEPSEELDHRMLSSYADQIERRPLWKLLSRGTIPLPIPIAAMIVLTIISLGYLVFRSSPTVVMQAPKLTPGEQVRIVEVPIIQDRVVIRTVYVNRPSGTTGNSPSKMSAENRGRTFDSGGFKPVDEFTIRPLKEGEQYEK